MNIENIIKQIAPQLPIVMEYSTELHYVDGSELIAQGHTEFEDGTKVFAGIKYKQNMPVMVAMNHKRRLREAFKREGQQGILNYIDGLKKYSYEKR